VFGGRGNVFGTLLGLLFLLTLQNGLHLLAIPSEATGVLTGVLLLLVVGMDVFRENAAESGKTQASLKMGKITLAGLASAGVVAVIATLVFFLMRHSATTANVGVRRSHRPVIAVMPKAKGDPYFVSARAGAEQAARELGVDLIWDGPTSLDASQ